MEVFGQLLNVVSSLTLIIVRSFITKHETRKLKAHLINLSYRTTPFFM